MALPAMHALARIGRLEIFAPAWGGDLYRDVPARVRPRGLVPPVDAAVLFPPSLRAALETLGARERIGTATDHRGPLLTRIVAEGPHRFDTYRALAGAVGARADGPPSWPGREGDPVADVPAGHVGLNPVSVSGDVREWPHFGALAQRLRGPVVVYGGPGEGPRVAARAGGRPTRIGLSLPAFAAALRRCALFVSNDSGAAHFARACGVRTLVLYGSTRPERTGPLGAHAIVGPAVGCAPCYRQRCRHALECFDFGLDEVVARIEALGGAPSRKALGGAPSRKALR
jgi:heptosyltransferase II